MSSDDWASYSQTIPQAMNSKQNNTVECMKRAFVGKCTIDL